MAVPERLVPLEGAFNFRDLGGYPSDYGGHTRWGTLFRSDTLHELTEGDVEVLRGLGLTTVVDLRTPTELERTGRGRLEPEPIGFHHLSVLGDGIALSDREGRSTPSIGSPARPPGERAEERTPEPGEAIAAPAPAGDDLADRYLWYLDVGRASLVEALEIIGDPGRLPLVFHCAAGKDRTGVLAALVLDLVGVGHDVIVDDYLLTASRMEPILERYRRSDPDGARRLAELPAASYGVEAVTMRSFLDEVSADFGSARAWAEGAGVAATTLDRLPGLLLEP